jgi:hypothetical protein
MHIYSYQPSGGVWREVLGVTEDGWDGTWSSSC